MNLQQKFLLLFADYRAMRDDTVRLGDEVTLLRGQIEDERKRFDALLERFAAREERLNDRMIEARFPVRPAPAERQEMTTTPGSPKAWVKKHAAEFVEDLKRRQQTLNGSADLSSHTD